MYKYVCVVATSWKVHWIPHKFIFFFFIRAILSSCTSKVCLSASCCAQVYIAVDLTNLSHINHSNAFTFLSNTYMFVYIVHGDLHYSRDNPNHILYSMQRKSDRSWDHQWIQCVNTLGESVLFLLCLIILFWFWWKNTVHFANRFKVSLKMPTLNNYECVAP